MEEQRGSRRVLEANFGGRRAVGRPRGRWEDAVRADANNPLGTRNWNCSEEQGELEEEDWGDQGLTWAVVPYNDDDDDDEVLLPSYEEK